MYISISYTAIFMMNDRLLFDNSCTIDYKSKCLEILFTIFQNLKVSPSGQYHFYTMYIPVYLTLVKDATTPSWMCCADVLPRKGALCTSQST